MKFLLIFIFLLLFGGAGWFYVTQYEPVVQTASDQASKIDSLNLQLSAENAQVSCLKQQVNSLTETDRANESKIASLKSQLNLGNIADPGGKVFVPPNPLPAQPHWTWTLPDRVYHNVVVTRVEPDCVHITYDGGIGDISTANLPPDLQKVFNYDPALASQAAEEKAAEKAKIEAEQAPLIAAELQREKAQAAEDEAERVKNINDQAAADNVAVAKDQEMKIEDDIKQMIAAHEVTVSTNTQTGAVSYGGTTYWLDRFYADQQAIAKWDKIINANGK